MQNTFPVSNKKLEEHVNDPTKHITANSIGFPDLANSSLITGTSFTAPSDGWISICPRSGPIWSFIDNICIAYAATDCGGDAFLFQSLKVVYSKWQKMKQVLTY